MRTLPFLLLLCLSPISTAESVSPKEALSEALYTEEVTRDPNAAAKQYAQILESFHNQRAHASTALFRLAEIRNKQGKTDEAIKHYQAYLTNFSDLEPQASLAREHLTKLGGAAPANSPGPQGDEQAKELARLKGFLETAPDLLIDPDNLEDAASANWLNVIDFLLAHGSDPWKSSALSEAVQEGYLGAAQKLIEHSPKVPHDIAQSAVFTAYERNRHTILDYLLEQGFPTTTGPNERKGHSLLMLACSNNDRPLIDKLIKRGSPLDWHSQAHKNGGNPRQYRNAIISPLFTAINGGHYDLASHLLDCGASADLSASIQNYSNIQPLHFVANQPSGETAKLIALLISKGADPGALIDKSPSENIRVGVTMTFPGLTPLGIALQQGNLNTIEALLEGGADPNKPSEQNRAYSVFTYLLSSTESPPELIDTMLSHGATITPEFYRKVRPSIARSALPALDQRFLFPSLAKNSEVTVHDSTQHRYYSIKPITAEGLNDPTAYFLWNLPALMGRSTEGSQAGRKPLQETPGRYRLNPEMELIRDGKSQTFNVTQEAPLPLLAAGDVLRINTTAHSGNPADPIQQAIRRRVSFPIKVVFPDKTHSVQVRGDYLTPDIHKRIVPLVRPRDIVSQLLVGFTPATAKGCHTQIVRKDGSRLVVSDAKTPPMLQPHDRIEVSFDPGFGIADPRQEQIRLYSPNYPFRREIYFQHGLEPTVFEILGNFTQQLDRKHLTTLKTDPNAAFAALTEEHHSSTKAFLPHPDFTKIKIWRPNKTKDGTAYSVQSKWDRSFKDQGDGTSSITINLHQVIASLPLNPSRADIDRLDVTLTRGDLIEIPVRANKLSNPGPCYTEREAKFFHALFRAKFDIETKSGRILPEVIAWNPPVIQSTPFGTLCFNPVVGTTDTDIYTSLRRVFGSPGSTILRRGEEQLKPKYSSGLYLRDGDYLMVTKEETLAEKEARNK